MIEEKTGSRRSGAVVITPDKRSSSLWKELWIFRDLFFYLAWRDLLVRYKQTIIGITWAVIRPLLTMVVLSVVFGKLARLPSGDVPYPILVFTAMIPWQFFSNALSECNNSIIANAGMITKIYFPRFFIPASSVIVCFVDLLLSFGILVLMMAWYDFWPSYHFLLLPLFFLLVFCISLGIGLWVAAMNVKYRDFRYIVPFVVQIGLYLSPVGYASQIVPLNWRLIYSLNPMVGVIDGFRWALTGGIVELYAPAVYVSVMMAMALLFLGGYYFSIAEKKFADVI